MGPDGAASRAKSHTPSRIGQLWPARDGSGITVPAASFTRPANTTADAANHQRYLGSPCFLENAPKTRRELRFRYLRRTGAVILARDGVPIARDRGARRIADRHGAGES